MSEAELIETIVREVVRRLQTMGVTSVAAANGSANGSTGGQSLEVEQRVVTMAVFGDRLSELTSVVVRNDAIVTPLVLDELRDRKVKLVRKN